ncbi:DUF4288 domain-containing protein [Alteromonas sp. KUL49]|uniref:DUF4288 domain-containing protein n=1 Tax=Alteromonas sp. KUL49 TaxID=2480798 RepID=UPI00102F092D|nr:DUF4288 domain-containing protein [Alteromonas sp. KUL49]TAP40946.1 DUF4288 domain-containing protein [Alteromonas sp. KUL49]GEA11128.1 hypothetical protein KUL49_15030 [Alteromonas sp. KUL49]
MSKQGKVNSTWWVAALVERFQFDHEDLSNPKRRCRAFTNTIILQAEDRNHAYTKAIEYGKLGKDENSDWSDEKGRKGKWVFEGLASLTRMIDQEIDPDGTEICFEDDIGISVGRVKSWIRSKEELEAFNGDE